MLGLFLDHFAMSPVIHKGNKIIIFNSLSPAPRAADAAASTTKKKSQKIALLPIASKFGPQEVDSFSQLCA